MGNTKARKLYEANLPDNFRRPQTDQAVEFFIRDKYDKKKYYDKSGLNGTTTSSDSVLPSTSSPSLQAAAEKNKLEKEKEKKEEKKKEKESERVKKPASFDALKTLQKKEEKQVDSRSSPLKTAEPAIDLLGLDAPAVANGRSTTTNAPLSDDLDIFGPMISNPLPSSTTPFPQATSSKPAATTSAAVSGDLDLFTKAPAKSEESAKKPLSKDSILSLYSTGSMQQQTAPGFSNMGAPVPASTGMMGPVMGQNAGMMVGMAMPNGYMGNAQTGAMGQPQNVMGPQGGMPGNVTNPQNVYGMQANQQGQWNPSQMNQQMAGMNLVGPSPMMGFGQPANTMGNWTGSTSGQTLSTQLWK
ncbi:stromal membrane-associated protein 1-like [Polyodon spathula]|uniref:stromal membrane-associated protein 1-like n=1 Tax=Polyodon spathula TaxID=7913 RepID=UPI001B7E1519|nr:stromal membrane-associated protein 1-like [Polyodon spathula]